jgi:PAS domain S-box-containing protein
MGVFQMISVLCIDDEQSFIEMTRAFLELGGDMVVDAAPSPLEAIEMMKKHQYDAIVSDYQMPGMDGIRFLTYVRNRFGNIPFILFTGKGREEVVIQALNCGVDFYLQKGGDAKAQFAELAHKVRQSVDRHRQNEALALAQFSVENAAVATFWIEQSGAFLRVNKEACQSLGYSEHELFGKHVWDIDPGFSKEAWEKHWHDLEGKGKLTFDSQHKCKGGRTFPVEITANFMEVNGRKYNFAFARDITESKQVEQRLREVVESYKTLAENLPGLVYRCWLRENSRMTFFNDMLLPLTGYSAEELKQGDVCSIEPYILDEDRPAVVKAVKDAVRLDRPFAVEYRLRTKAGDIRFFIERGRPLRGADGKPLCIDGVIFDVTDRMRAETSIRESEQRFRQMSDLLPAVVFQSDLDGNLTFVNEFAYGMTGFTREDFLKGLNGLDLLAPEDRDRAMREMSEVIKSGRVGSSEYVLLRKDGTPLPISFHATPVIAEGKPAGLLGVMVDVTRIRKSEGVRTAAYKISQAVMSASSLEELFKYIHSILGELMPADNFFIALRDESKEMISFPYFVDQSDPPPAPRMMGKGVTEYVIFSGRPLLVGLEELEEMRNRKEVEITGALPVSFLGVPLQIGKTTTGAMAVQSYDEGLRYGEEELEILQFVSSQVAQAIERKRSEDEIQRSLSLLRATFESTADGILLVDSKGGGVISNERFAKMWCVPDSIMNTRNDERLLEFVRDQLSDPEQFEERVSWLYAHPEEMAFDTVSFKDGRCFERYSQPCRIGGNVTGRIWSFRDISEKRKAEEALMHSESELKAIINSAKDSIFVKDRDLTYRMVNDAMAELLDLEAARMVGLKEADLFGETAAKETEVTDHLVLAGEVREEEVIRSIRGVTHIFSMIKVPLRQEDGTILGICGIARDMTERKRVEKALQEANASLNMLNSITRHDVLNQLMVIRGYSDLVRVALKDQKHVEYMDKVEKAVRTIRSQIQFTRDFQRLGSVEPKWHNVEELLDQALSTLETGTLEVSVDLSGLEIFADPMLEKVFYNFIDNTMRHGEQVKKIGVSCRKEKDGLLLLYEDDGVGVAPEDKERIFDRGFGKNTGLGLFLVRAILRVTQITVSETGEQGKGVRFELHVPDGAYRFHEWDEET